MKTNDYLEMFEEVRFCFALAISCDLCPILVDPHCHAFPDGYHAIPWLAAVSYIQHTRLSAISFGNKREFTSSFVRSKTRPNGRPNHSIGSHPRLCSENPIELVWYSPTSASSHGLLSLPYGRTTHPSRPSPSTTLSRTCSPIIGSSCSRTSITPIPPCLISVMILSPSFEALRRRSTAR